jgi:hypothetical protein
MIASKVHEILAAYDAIPQRSLADIGRSFACSAEYVRQIAKAHGRMPRREASRQAREAAPRPAKAPRVYPSSRIEIAKRLVCAMASRNMTIPEVAQRSGLSARDLHAVTHKGSARIDVSPCARALEVPLYWLMHGGPSPDGITEDLHAMVVLHDHMRRLVMDHLADRGMTVSQCISKAPREERRSWCQRLEHGQWCGPHEGILSAIGLSADEYHQDDGAHQKTGANDQDSRDAKTLDDGHV